MKITEETKKFWKVVEGDLVEIPAYIKNIFTRYGFGNAVSLKCLDDEGLNNLKNLVKTDLAIEFEEQIADPRHKEWFFGNSKDPKNFDFIEGDLKLIKEMVKYVKSKVDVPTENANTDHFKNEKKSKRKSICERNLFQTVLGLAYGYALETEARLPEIIDIKKLSQDLFEKTNSEFKKYHEKDVFEPLREFVIDMVTDVIANDVNRNANGAVLCCYCDSKISVHCKSIDTSSWTMSNISTHMSRNHPEEFKRVKENGPQQKKRKTVALIQPSKKTTLENIINNQLEEQIAKVKISCGLTAERTDNDGDLICVQTPNESNCLFLSLCHQLHYDCNDKMISNLRSEVVKHIKKNLKHYETVLEQRVKEIKKDKKASKTTTRSFVIHHLKQPNTFGGRETIMAIKEMHKVNIITVDEDGTVLPPANFDQTLNRTLLICFKGDFHYQSVANASKFMVDDLTEQISEIHKSNDIQHNNEI